MKRGNVERDLMRCQDCKAVQRIIRPRSRKRARKGETRTHYCWRCKRETPHVKLSRTTPGLG